jgi:phosphatidylserine/phosphatidylglycerophosphate/cardiolipin synthase-like enzyme
MKFTLALLSFTLMGQVFAQSGFIAEKGNYAFDSAAVEHELRVHVPYVHANKSVAGGRYKLLDNRHEFQLQHWFAYDWYKLQALFSLDVEAFIHQYRAGSFNEAKRRQYQAFPFNKKTYLHRKLIPAMREWGGLTHPPLRKLDGPLSTYHSSYHPIDYDSVASAFFSPQLQQKIDAITGSELSFGNEVHALADHQSFLKKKEIISRAKSSILVSALAMVCDQSTREFVRILKQKKKEGLFIKVMVDGVMNRALTDFSCPQELRNAGIELIDVGEFLKFKTQTIYHSKLVIADLREAVGGGQNFLNADHMSRGTDFMNRDVDLYARGPMVRDMAEAFLGNWEHHYALKKIKAKYPISSGIPLLKIVKTLKQQEVAKGLRGVNHYASILSRPATRMHGVCRFVNQTPFQRPYNIGEAYLQLLNQTSKYLVITDPIKSDTKTLSVKGSLRDYVDSFTMFNKLHDKVQELIRKGIKLDYVTTNIDMAGNEFVAMTHDQIREKLKAGRIKSANLDYGKIIAVNYFYGIKHYKNLMKDYTSHKNVNVWNHISFLHSKIFYFDRIVASVGSYNFQHNATDHAYESTSICMDQTLNHEIDNILVLDMANSIPLVFKNLE